MRTALPLWEVLLYALPVIAVASPWTFFARLSRSLNHGHLSSYHRGEGPTGQFDSCELGSVENKPGSKTRYSVREHVRGCRIITLGVSNGSQRLGCICHRRFMYSLSCIKTHIQIWFRIQRVDRHLRSCCTNIAHLATCRFGDLARYAVR